MSESLQAVNGWFPVASSHERKPGLPVRTAGPAAQTARMPKTIDEVRDEVALVQAARAGDRFAFGQLYQRYGRMVHGMLLARVPPTVVDDLVQDVFVKAMTQLRHLRDEARFGPWLAAITRNRANDHFRGSRETEEVPDDLAVEENASAEADARVALEAIRRLPETYRETLMLRLVEGMSGPEIAERTGLTPDSVRVNLHRGFKLLRERLAPRSDAGTKPKERGTS